MTQSNTLSVDTADMSRRDRLDLDKLPGPEPIPLLGWYGAMLRFGRDPLGYLDMLATGGYGPIVAISRGARRGLINGSDRAPGALLAFGHDYHRQIMVNDAYYGGALPATAGGNTARILKGLPWMPGEQHGRQRRILYPMYHQRRIQDYGDSAVRSMRRMFDRWKVDESIGVMDESVRMLCDFEEDMVLGVTPEQGELAQVGNLTIPFFNRFVRPVSHIPLNIPFTPRWRMLQAGEKVWEGFDKLVHAKRAEGAGGKDACSLLLQARYEDGSAMTHDEVVAETVHLFFAGWFTTRGPLAWMAFLLAMHPKVHADLYDELHGKLAGDVPTLEQLKQLPLLDAVVKETLRLFPPIYLVVRQPLHPVQLGDYQIPAGTECHMSIYHSHRDPNLYPEPLRFKPERWETLKPGPYAYLPYGIGERSCIGVALANMQLRLMFAMLVQQYRMEVPQGLKVDQNGLGLLLPLSDKSDLRLIVRKQDRCFTKSRTNVTGNVHRMVDLRA